MALDDLGTHPTVMKCGYHFYHLPSFYLIRETFLWLPPTEAAALPLSQLLLAVLHMHGRSAFTELWFSLESVKEQRCKDESSAANLWTCNLDLQREVKSLLRHAPAFPQGKVLIRGLHHAVWCEDVSLLQLWSHMTLGSQGRCQKQEATRYQNAVSN